MCRVPKEWPQSAVVAVLGREWMAVIEMTPDLINVWPEEETCKMMALDAAMPKDLKQKAIGQRLRTENKEIKNRKRYGKN